MEQLKLKVGRPKNQEESDNSGTMIVCKICLSEIAPGKGHNCKKTQKRENIVSLIRNSSDQSKSSVLVSGLMEVAEKQGESTRGGTVTLQSGSRQIPVQIGTKRGRDKEPQLSHANLKSLGRRLNLSNSSLI